MKIPAVKDAVEQVRWVLGDVLHRPIYTEIMSVRHVNNWIDAVFNAGDLRFVVEWKGAEISAIVSQAADQALLAVAKEYPRSIPLVAVPFMGDAGRKVCERKGVCWIDLSGNADIRAPGIIILREGKPNLFKRLGRPSNPFAPKSSRFARWFLVHPGEEINQSKLAKVTGLGEGFVSQLVSRLSELELISRSHGGSIRVINYGRLLDAWRERYDFQSHSLFYGHVAARSGEELLKEISSTAKNAGVELAFTGLAGAWLYDRFANFRIVTAFIKQPFDEAWLKPLSFRSGEQGANLWLAYPKDMGVFEGVKIVNGISVVHPLQVFLDLKGHPERASEAADELRKRHLVKLTNE